MSISIRLFYVNFRKTFPNDKQWDGNFKWASKGNCQVPSSSTRLGTK